ncbi:MAG: HesA/MoeB/ThiF family protein [Planctomycetota bacterium]|nr:MAG: HesA/MoeB/ThiF family protein [Planctomycetota bacterium]
MPLPDLTDEERATYEWQMWVPGFGELGQRKLKRASVLVSRIGGVGGLVAYQLAAAGVGRLVLAHAGNVKPSDLNRQLLMTHDQVGKPRIDSAVRRLRELNPRLQIRGVAENVHPGNARALVEDVDLVVDCAPLFEERFAMNDAAVQLRKPMVECAMYDMEAQITTIVPGQTPCLRCLHPEAPRTWTRQFPVFGAVSGVVACLAAVEAIKMLTGIGQPLTGRILKCDLRNMNFFSLQISRRADCPTCMVQSQESSDSPPSNCHSDSISDA